MFDNTIKKIKKAYLVCAYADMSDAEYRAKELELLTKSALYEIVKCNIFQPKELNARTYFGSGKAEEIRDELASLGADVVILDPPRRGCEPELLKAAAETGAERIVYVSCDPATLARDVKLLGESGYVFAEAQPVDMFPHTTHIENLVLLKRR